jgi:type I restriction enzyme S subunit
MSATRLRYLLRPREIINRTSLQVLSVYRDYGIIPKNSRSDNFNKTPEDITRYQEVREGDLVVNKMKAWQGSVGISDYHGIVSPDYLVCSVDQSVDSRFMHHLLRSTRLAAEFGARSKGIRPAQWRLYWEDLAEIPITLPSIDEQRRIADFLDAETARIDRIITIRQKHSELSAQRFTQIVDGVVAGNKDALAEIGFHKNTEAWSLGRVTRLFSVIPGFAFASDNFVRTEEGTRLLRGINVAPGRIDWDAETVAWDLKTAPIDRRFHLRLDDLVVGMDRPWISGGTRIALIREPDLPSLLLQRVACIRSRSASTTRYLRWALGSNQFKLALESETTGVSVPHISGEQIGAFTYQLPPPEEQIHLATLLESQEALHAAQVELMDKQLDLLRERRQALITAAVTGGITV